MLCFLCFRFAVCFRFSQRAPFPLFASLAANRARHNFFSSIFRPPSPRSFLFLLVCSLVLSVKVPTNSLLPALPTSSLAHQHRTERERRGSMEAPSCIFNHVYIVQLNDGMFIFFSFLLLSALCFLLVSSLLLSKKEATQRATSLSLLHIFHLLIVLSGCLLRWSA